jgi:hypothetical protein
MQLDIGFGDVVVPQPVTVEYPTILPLPAPQLRGYSRESAIAEKFEAMVKLGILNSVIKHSYWRFDLEEPVKLDQDGFVPKLLIGMLIKD